MPKLIRKRASALLALISLLAALTPAAHVGAQASPGEGGDCAVGALLGQATPAGGPLPGNRFMATGRRHNAPPSLESGLGEILLTPLPFAPAAPPAVQADVVTTWNVVATSVTGDWRATTIAHLAIHDALNAIDRRFEPYAVDERAPSSTSREAAVAAAARRVLIRLVPSDTAAIDAAYATSLATVPAGPARDEGIALGERVADRLVDLRADDGFYVTVAYNPAPGIGVWQPTPPAFLPAASPEWAAMRPFAIQSGSQFRPGPPPALTDGVYTRDYNEVRMLGGLNSAVRTADQTDAARYWDQRTSPAWNRITRAALAGRGLDLWEEARLFALVNMANSDAAISTWDSKYTYGFWRPTSAIRQGGSDGNPRTPGDPGWQPLRNTPNHPDYAAGHSGAGGAVVRVLQLFFGTDDVPTTTVGGSNVGRSFPNLSSTVEDVTTGRVAIGAHFRFSCDTAARMGRQIGQYTFRHYLREVRPRGPK